MKCFLLLIIAFPLLGNAQFPLNISNDPSWNITPQLSDEFNQNHDESDPQNIIVCDPSKWVNYTPWIGHPNDPAGNTVACESFDNITINTENVSGEQITFLCLSISEQTNNCIVGYDNSGPIYEDRNYSAGVLFSQEDQLQKYGYWEIKMRIPHPPQPGVDQGDFYGLSANAWLWNSWGNSVLDADTNVYSEIDLAEIHPNHIDVNSIWGWRNNRHTCNVHFDPHEDAPVYPDEWPLSGPSEYVDDCDGIPCVQFPEGYFTWDNTNNFPIWHSNSRLTMRNNTEYGPVTPEDADLNLSPGWHIFSCMWLPDKITMYVDGEMVNSTTVGCPGLSRLGWVVGPAAGNQFGETNFTSNTVLPYNMDIDYIRTYSLDASMDCNTVINNCAWDPDSYDHTVKKSITYGGSSPSCSNSIDSSPGVYLKATDFIQINGNFTVPAGNEFAAEIFVCQ